jgi:hypothetical protein
MERLMVHAPGESQEALVLIAKALRRLVSSSAERKEGITGYERRSGRAHMHPDVLGYVIITFRKEPTQVRDHRRDDEENLLIKSSGVGTFRHESLRVLDEVKERSDFVSRDTIETAYSISNFVIKLPTSRTYRTHRRFRAILLSNLDHIG